VAVRERVRIDPETRQVAAPDSPDGPFAVAVGARAVWVTCAIQFAHGRLRVTTQRCGSPVIACSDS